MLDHDVSASARGNNDTAPRSDNAAPASPLIPPALAFLVEERPLLWYEDGAQYEALLNAIVAELAPQGAVELILVKELADYIWELRRMRRLKVSAIHAEMPKMASRMLAQDYDPFAGTYRDKPHLLMLARATVNGLQPHAADSPSGESLASRAEQQCVTPEALHYETCKANWALLEAITQETARLEARRNQLLRQIEDRRARLAAMAKGLLAREEVEVIEIAQGQ